jgi:hypothetical protein
MHALDAPVTARSVSEPVDIKRGRRDVEARLERAAIGIFDARKNLDEGLYVGEARLTGITPGGDDPVDIA